MTKQAVQYFLFATIFAFASCKLEPCKDYVCINGTPLEDGKNCICLCDLGWEGVDCTIEDKCVTNQVFCNPPRGYCNSNGVCVCGSGYEGDSCEILSRDKFLSATKDTSKWDVTDTCESVVYQYQAMMVKASDDQRLEILNIRDLGATQFIQVNANKLTLTQRTSATIGTVTIRNFSGTLLSDLNTLRVNYDSEEGLTSDCSGTWLRK